MLVWNPKLWLKRSNALIFITNHFILGTPFKVEAVVTDPDSAIIFDVDPIHHHPGTYSLRLFSIPNEKKLKKSLLVYDS